MTPAELPKDAVYGKERRLIELAKDDLAQGRKVFAYCQYTGRKDVTARLQELLVDEGIGAEVLRASVKPEEREDWLSGNTVRAAKPNRL